MEASQGMVTSAVRQKAVRRLDAGGGSRRPKFSPYLWKATFDEVYCKRDMRATDLPCRCAIVGG